MKRSAYLVKMAGVTGLLGVMACGGTAAQDGFVSGSSSINASGDLLYVADGDNSALARVNTQSGDVTSLVVGAEPTRVARIGDRIYITLRAERSVAVVSDDGGTMTLLGVYEVGAEPYGIVAAPDGKSVYVALSVENAIVQLDAETLEELMRFDLAASGMGWEPRWLAITPNGRYLYVGTARGNGIVQVDTETGKTEVVDPPEVSRGDDETGEIVVTTPRITGDPVISDDGTMLAVPFLYTDVTTSVGPTEPEENGGDVDIDMPPRGGGGGYAAGNVEGLTRFNPAVVTVPLDVSGDTKGPGTAMLVSGRADLDGLVTEPPEFQRGNDMGFGGEPMFDTAGFSMGFDGNRTRVRGYLSSLVFSKDGNAVLATIEGGRSIAAIASRPVELGQPFGSDDDPFFGDGAFETTPRVFIGTDHGPQGLARMGDGRMATYSFLGRSVSTVDYADIEGGLEALVMGDFFGDITWHTGTAAKLPASILPPDVQEGRKLFYSSSDSAMAVAGAGVSCATCHFEGRNDGITWDFDGVKRQTPSLAGKVSATAPVTWSSEVQTVMDEVRITSQGRMGGHGLTDTQMLDVASFIDWTRDVDVPTRPALAAAVERGREIFTRADVGCATCHSGERLTDNESYAMFGEAAVNTPPLAGLVVTAPYLHDGSAATLRDVVDGADAGGMGKTGHLSETEKQDLVSYLESL